MKYRVIIEETVSQEFSVEAQSRKVAEEKARQMYEAGAFVLEPGHLEEVRFIISDDE